MDTVHRLGYHPSWVARGLATQRTRTLGLVVPDITNPFFPEIARGVQDVARVRDYRVFLCNTDGSAEQELQAPNSLADSRWTASCCLARVSAMLTWLPSPTNTGRSWRSIVGWSIRPWE